jgi:hypothetical protein
MVDDFDDYTMIMGKYTIIGQSWFNRSIRWPQTNYQRPHHESIGVVKKLVFDTAEI